MSVMNDFPVPVPAIAGYTLRYLTPEDGPQAQALCERAADYLEMIMGLPPGPAEAQSLYLAVPPGKDGSDKALLGIFDGETLIGAVDAVRDYPEPGEWWLGLLLLDPEHRGQGIGAATLRAFSEWTAMMGARGVRLGVVEQNARALAFWRRHGFIELERRLPSRFGARERRHGHAPGGEVRVKSCGDARLGAS